MHATVVESADTRDLKSLGVKSVSVQVRSVAPKTGEIHSNFSRFVMFGKRLGSKFLPFLPKNRRFLLILFELHNL